ncbi:MAG: hypothetical protein J6U23_03885 [Clostridiales bacterium]|nr:hypothetical protein [Clostridiales bacterium]
MIMISVNRYNFANQSLKFESECGNNKVTERTEEFSNSEGIAIEELNKCFKSYNDFCKNLNNVYSSTSNYLMKASASIEACEADNKM